MATRLASARAASAAARAASVAAWTSAVSARAVSAASALYGPSSRRPQSGPPARSPGRGPRRARSRTSGGGRARPRRPADPGRRPAPPGTRRAGRRPRKGPCVAARTDAPRGPAFAGWPARGTCLWGAGPRARPPDPGECAPRAQGRPLLDAGADGAALLVALQRRRLGGVLMGRAWQDPRPPPTSPAPRRPARGSRRKTPPSPRRPIAGVLRPNPGRSRRLR